MKVLLGYLRTIGDYMQTRKGRHDSLDYLRALVLIVATMLLAIALVYIVGEVAA